MNELRELRSYLMVIVILALAMRCAQEGARIWDQSKQPPYNAHPSSVSWAYDGNFLRGAWK